MDILSLFACFELLLPKVAVRQLAIIAQAILTLTGRISMLGISRWTEKGGSYRTIQRFFSTVLPWHEIFSKFFETHIFNPAHEYILAGDETVVSKSGKQTFGIDRFFSGLKGKVIKGLSFFVFSVVDVSERKSYPLAIAQTVKNELDKPALKNRKKRQPKKPKARPGRPAGSRNRDKNELKLSPELLRINAMLVVLLKLMRGFIKVRYLAMDGYFGHSQAVLMAKENGLELISKLRKDAAIFEKHEGRQKAKGAKKKYGERLKYDILSPKYLKKSEREKEVITNYYQGEFLHKEFGSELNVVIIARTKLENEKVRTRDIVQ